MEASVEMVKKAAAKGPGRPAKAPGDLQTNVPVRFPPAMIEAIDAERAARIDAPDRSTLIRELVASGLAQLQNKKGRK